MSFMTISPYYISIHAHKYTMHSNEAVASTYWVELICVFCGKVHGHFSHTSIPGTRCILLMKGRQYCEPKNLF